MSAALVVAVALVPARASPGPVGALLCALLSVVGVALRNVTGVAGHGQYLCAQISQFGVRNAVMQRDHTAIPARSVASIYNEADLEREALASLRIAAGSAAAAGRVTEQGIDAGGGVGLTRRPVPRKTGN
jgi:hypothetical protein